MTLASVGVRGAGSQVLLRSAFVLNGGFGVDCRFRRHARPQQAIQPAIVEHDFDRHTLNNLGEIAGGVVGRQQGELESAGGRETVDVAPQDGRMKAVDLELDRLPVTNMGELRLLEIGDDVDRVERHYRHQLRSGLHELTDPERAGAYSAVYGRNDLGVGEIEFSLLLESTG